jgi:hypothetical protein
MLDFVTLGKAWLGSHLEICLYISLNGHGIFENEASSHFAAT